MAIASSTNSYLLRTTDLLDYNAAYTVMAWFNHIDASRGFHTLLNIRAGSSANQDAIFIDDNTSGFYLQSRTGGVQSEVASYATSYGWNHIAMRRNSSTSLDLIANGNTLGTLTPDVSARIAPAQTRIGNNFPHAFLSLFAYSAALSNEQIRDQMNFSNPRRTANLREWLPLESGSARSVDFSGNGRDFTEFGTLSNADGLLLVRPSLMIPRRACLLCVATDANGLLMQ